MNRVRAFPSTAPGWVSVLLLFCTLIVVGCRTRTAPQDRFHALSEDYVHGHFDARPLEGIAVGWHRYDGRFVPPTRAALMSERERLKRFETLFNDFPADRLGTDEKLDLEILRLVVARQLWGLDTEQGWRRNPMFYAGALDVSFYLKRDFKPLKERVADMTAILRQAPAVFDAARENLEPILPRPFVETAIEIARGTASFLESDVLRTARQCGDPMILGTFEPINAAAAAQCRDFAQWLISNRLPSADGRYALGRDGFAALLKTEGIDLTPEAILEMGLRELKAEQARFDAAAREIDPSRPAAEVFKSIQRDHPTAEALIPDTRRNLEMIRAFIVNQGLVTLPSEVRARVEPTLPPFRATSFASMDTPGPFETRATEAYYYVTPVEPDWKPEQAEEWLSAFNYYTTDVVSIHEAYPGHYVQFLALNASRAGTVQKVFPSYSFAEGWAHYTEQMVLEAGFMQVSDPTRATREERVRAAKYRLAQSDEALLRLCRLCCAVQLHCNGMSVEEATRFFRDNCHYEEKPARSEATRGTFDPGYLYYTLGKLQILQLRETARREAGQRFSLRRFHDELLAHGAPPIRLLEPFLIRAH